MKVAVIGAAVLWGTAGTAGLLAAGVDPVSLASARLVIGGLVLGERLTPVSAGGLALLGAGLAAVALPARRSARGGETAALRSSA